MVARQTSGWEARAVVDLATGAAGTPVDAVGAEPVDLAGFDRRAGCVGMTETGGSSVRRSCCHWRTEP